MFVIGQTEFDICFSGQVCDVEIFIGEQLHSKTMKIKDLMIAFEKNRAFSSSVFLVNKFRLCNVALYCSHTPLMTDILSKAVL